MSNSTPGGWAHSTRRNTANLAIWTGSWVLTLAVAVFGSAFVWESRSISLFAILLNVAAGAGMIAANKRFLDGLDELQRKIQLEAMALALGVALVAGIAYSTLHSTGVIEFDAEISNLVILISLTYMCGIFLGRRKYQ
jgi:hypothetical protein